MTANYRLIRSLDPLFRRADCGARIFLTSRIGIDPRLLGAPIRRPRPGSSALVKCYADEMEHTKVRCSLVDPGQMRTKMHATAFPGADPDTITPPDAIKPADPGAGADGHRAADPRCGFPDWAAGAGGLGLASFNPTFRRPRAGHP